MGGGRYPRDKAASRVSGGGSKQVSIEVSKSSKSASQK